MSSTAIDQCAEFFGIVRRMRRKRDVDEGDQVEAERLRREVGVIASDDLFLLEPHPPPRALRSGQSDQVGELLVGEPAVILQCGQHFEVEGVDVDHAQFIHFVHKACMTLAKRGSLCMHIAPDSTENLLNN